MKTRMTALCFAAATATATAASLAAPARAQQNCAPREMVVEQLAERYGESRQSMGLGANNAVMEVFASEETGSWTITVTTVHGMTCMVASGQAYEGVAEALAMWTATRPDAGHPVLTQGRRPPRHHARGMSPT